MVSRSQGTQTLGRQTSDCAPWTLTSTTVSVKGCDCCCTFQGSLWVAAGWRRGLRECRADYCSPPGERRVHLELSRGQSWGGQGESWRWVMGGCVVCVRVFNGKGGIGAEAAFVVGPKTERKQN